MQFEPPFFIVALAPTGLRFTLRGTNKDDPSSDRGRRHPGAQKDVLSRGHRGPDLAVFSLGGRILSHLGAHPGGPRAPLKRGSAAEDVVSPRQGRLQSRGRFPLVARDHAPAPPAPTICSK